MNNQKWPLVANTQISEYLKRNIQGNTVGGSYIFAGPDNLGKTTIALFFAQLLFCEKPAETKSDILPCGACSSCRKLAKKKFTNLQMEQGDLGDIHSDFYLLKKEKDKKNISIEQVRDFIHALSMSSFSNGYKVGIIKHSDTLSNEAANALLKTLEEPKAKVVIILIASDKESLPATIVSRSQILQFKPVASEAIYEYLIADFGVQREKARDISRLCLGRPALAVKFLENEKFYDFYNDKAQVFLDMQTYDFMTRFRLIEGFFDKKSSSQENVTLAHSILTIWQSVVRDYLLIILGHHNRVQHIYLHDKLKNMKRDRGLSDFVKLSHALREAHRFLDANVNPRLVFENIALNI